MKETLLNILSIAVEEYRDEGRSLMFTLGKKFGYDISIKDEYEELLRRGNPKVARSGRLSKNINYGFHGGECSFYNLKTQQAIEVILINAPQFGVLDSWFLKMYLDSTLKYKETFVDIDWIRLNDLIEQLYQKNKIEKVKKSY